ncbi:hypothetical protein ID866_5096 [Astraeus odoratus]|nr:hypothetical protein ID866_5096 [Astraeus odoratus]
MASTQTQTTISPHNQAPLCTRVYPSEAELDEKLGNAARAQEAWKKVDLKERIAIGRKFMEEFEKIKGDQLYRELTEQMGRPVSQVPGEIRGFLSRAEYMLSIAESSLADVSLKDTDAPGFRRYIKRVPLGVVFVIAPWNFPYLTSINSVLPAIVAGNSVLLKPSPQTPLAAERFATALHKLVDFVSFTGSVVGGQAVERAAVEAPGFKGVALEVLGGKDPAYVRSDADLDYTIAELVDVKAGAKALIPEDLFPIAQPNNAYVAPQVLVDVDHTMDIMTVTSDDEAIRLMNDSPYGLTASIWTNAAENPESEKAFLQIMEQLNTGTVFLNRCDFLDPALAWTGVKNSGRGVSLSKFGYDQLTRAKSVHMKIKTN